MLKEEFDSLSDDQKALVSVSYLLSHPELQPDETKRLYSKLSTYDQNAANIQEAIRQARKSIEELRPKLDQTIGAMTALSTVIAEMIPAEKFEEYCLAYELPEDAKVQIKKPAKKSEDAIKVDIAGSTAKDLPDPTTIE